MPEQSQLNWIANFIWNIAGDVLVCGRSRRGGEHRDLVVRVSKRETTSVATSMEYNQPVVNRRGFLMGSTVAAAAALSALPQTAAVTYGTGAASTAAMIKELVR